MIRRMLLSTLIAAALIVPAVPSMAARHQTGSEAGRRLQQLLEAEQGTALCGPATAPSPSSAAPLFGGV